MKKIALSSAILGGILVVLVHAPAQAQATRTWVSGVGDDVNPCSRTAPCKTFAGAISKTAAGGEINCIDPGGFGAVTINKNMTIDCAGTFGSILAAGTNGVNVNTTGTSVTLRNLSINGAGTGLVGINVSAGASLQLDNVVISNFQAGNATGIRFVPSASGKLFLNDVTLRGNGVGATGGGILIQPSGASVVQADINRVVVENSATGIKIDGTGSSSGINVTIRQSVVASSTQGGVLAIGGAPVGVGVDTTAVLNNSAFGIRATNASATILIGNSVVRGNDVGVSPTASGNVASYKNNSINANGSDGTPVPPVVLN